MCHDPPVTDLAYRLGVTSTSGALPWFWEGHVQYALAMHLVAEGWSVREAADTESKVPGVDLLATRDDRWLAIEVKGYPTSTYSHGPKRGQAKPTQPATQARQWFSHALLGMMLLRDKRLDAEIAICFPRFVTYENLVRRCQMSFDLLGFGVYFVNEDSSVALVLQHRGVDSVASTPVEPRSAQANSRGAAEAEREATCRAEILAAFGRLQRRHGRAVFAPAEIVQEVLSVTDRYPEQTIRTEIVSRMCGEAPTHHAVAYDDLERVGRAQYRVRQKE